MMKKFVSIALVIVLLMGTGCAKEEKKIILGSKPMTEQFILAEMLTLLIEKNTDIHVEQNLGIGGGTSNIHPAMEVGQIDLYPEYTGTGWLFVLKNQLIRDPDELYGELKSAYNEKYNMKWLGLYGFNNTYCVAVKPELVNKYNLKNVSDLAKVSQELKFGANYDFFEREDGFEALKEAYNFNFKEKVDMDIALKYDALMNNEIDVTVVFSTDGKLEENKLVVLEDNLNFFPSYYASTVVRNETLEKYPELEKVLELLTGQISNEEMVKMNYLVEIEKKEPKEVAREFLESKDLI